ncbi:unnamed protein product [Bursaphelenchus xylophilus]|uniref:(pine wood nematode) hypothetical protein n=1 Tax=Bursaphelenchus xylophilus TaxID=6326 RepID=A0A1I7S655_BURXY|nr:unnamed protein product [Bursaphelenchus xylophilus]CAG9082231.1 unnamed protein product [Bursaphelenchus xylophilus]
MSLINWSFTVTLLISCCNGIPLNCRDHYNDGDRIGGVRTVDINHQKIEVFCDQETYGGGWTVIQQRVDGSEPFWNRTWDEYKNGFGALGKNSSFYAGNELIHLLSKQYGQFATLRIELYGDQTPRSPYANDFYFQHYNFTLADEEDFYRMKIWLDWAIIVGNASAGWYDVTYSNNIAFSTIDKISDPDKQCQTKFRMGGWWTHYCGVASLNGEYTPEHGQYGKGYGMYFTILGLYIVHPVRVRMLVRDNRL